MYLHIKKQFLNVHKYMHTCIHTSARACAHIHTHNSRHTIDILYSELLSSITVHWMVKSNHNGLQLDNAYMMICVATVYM